MSGTRIDNKVQLPLASMNQDRRGPSLKRSRWWWTAGQTASKYQRRRYLNQFSQYLACERIAQKYL